MCRYLDLMTGNRQFTGPFDQRLCVHCSPALTHTTTDTLNELLAGMNNHNTAHPTPIPHHVQSQPLPEEIVVDDDDTDGNSTPSHSSSTRPSSATSQANERLCSVSPSGSGGCHDGSATETSNSHQEEIHVDDL